jgi:molybdenum cofactor guanylyltransferase
MAQNVFPFSTGAGLKGGWEQSQWYHFRVNRAGYVLAGGRSSRMGRDKAKLPFHGASLAEIVAREVALAAGKVTYVGRPDLGGIPDLYPGEGPLGGILTALRHTDADWNLIVACDMPEVTAAFLRHLVLQTRESSADIVLPYCGDRPEPLCAVYHRRTLGALEAAFASGIRKVTAAFGGLGVHRLDCTEVSVFQNVNTPEDWSVYAAE